MEREIILEYVEKIYGTKPEHLWKDQPDAIMLRHEVNKEWYAIFTNTPGLMLQMETEETVELINVKVEPNLRDALISSPGFLPAYHIDEEHWISIRMDGLVSEAKILDFLDMSHDLVEGNCVENKKTYGVQESDKVL